MDFPFDYRSSPFGRFRLKSCRYVAIAGTRLPLSSYCNPLSATKKSAQVISTALRTDSILFCKHGFKGQYRSQPRPRPETLHSPIPTYSRKAGYAAHSTRFCAPQCRFYPVSYAVRVSRRTGTAVAQEQVSTESGSVGICHYTSPGNLNPQHPP